MQILSGDNPLGAAMKALHQQTFYNTYWKYFDVVHAHTNDQKEKAFRLRYDVFCVENKIEGGLDTAAGLEQDAFDPRAMHFLLLHKESGDVAGTVRVITPDEGDLAGSFPLQDVCDHPLLQIDSKVARLCEISRLCMAKRFRRRPMDGKILPAYTEQEWGSVKAGDLGQYFRRRIPYAPLGLLRAGFETALGFGITDMICAMDPGHFRTMKRIGLSYRVLGPRIDYFGSQQPIVFNIKNALDNMAMENPECWEVISDKGRLHKKANTLAQNDWHDGVFDEDCRDMIMNKLL